MLLEISKPSVNMATRLERLILMEACIRRGECPSVDRLCRLFEVQPRTVYQDLKDLKERFKLDIRYDRHRNGYYSANPEQRLPEIALTEDELTLLLAALELLCQSGGESFRGALEAAATTLSSSAMHDILLQIRSVIGIKESDGNDISASLFLSLVKSCLQTEPVLLVTNHVHPATTLQVSAEKLLFAELWYLCGTAADGASIQVPVHHIQDVRKSLQ